METVRVKIPASTASLLKSKPRPKKKFTTKKRTPAMPPKMKMESERMKPMKIKGGPKRASVNEVMEFLSKLADAFKDSPPSDSNFEFSIEGFEMSMPKRGEGVVKLDNFTIKTSSKVVESSRKSVTKKA